MHTRPIQYAQHQSEKAIYIHKYLEHGSVLMHLSVLVCRGSVAASGKQRKGLTVGLAYC